MNTLDLVARLRADPRVHEIYETTVPPWPPKLELPKDLEVGQSYVQTLGRDSFCIVWKRNPGHRMWVIIANSAKEAEAMVLSLG